MGCLTLPALRPRASTRPINARVVRRSLALRGLAQQVSYSECSSVGLWLRLGWVYASRGLATAPRRKPKATLVTIPFSHYSELARWSLDATTTPYVEEPSMPGFHILAVMRESGDEDLDTAGLGDANSMRGIPCICDTVKRLGAA